SAESVPNYTRDRGAPHPHPGTGPSPVARMAPTGGRTGRRPGGARRGAGPMTTPTVTVRPGRIEDAEAEAALNRDAGWCWDAEYRIVEYHDDVYGASSVLVDEDEGRVFGKLVLFLGAKARHGRFGVIRRFVVHPDFRGQGIGRTLLDAATEHARAQG